MLLRFRIKAASNDQRGISQRGGLAEGPVEDRVFEIDAELPECRLGRQRGVEVELPFPAVSSVHARLVRGDVATEWTVEDLGSMNGSWLDEVRLVPKRPRAMRPGQRLRLACVEMIFEGAFSVDAARGGAVPEGTATIARRLISDLFGAVGGEAPTLAIEQGTTERSPLRLAELGRRYLLGRSPTCDLVLASDHVSREHVAVVRSEDGVLVSDLGSKNGVRVNGQVIAGAHRLADGDRIGIGIATLRFTDPEDRYLRHLESLASIPAAGHPLQDATGPSTEPPAQQQAVVVAAATGFPAETVARSETRPTDEAAPAPSEVGPEAHAPWSSPPPRSVFRWLAITVVVATAVGASAALLTLLLATR